MKEEKEFFKRIKQKREEYKGLAVPAEEYIDYTIERGTTKSLSAFVEDLFAVFLAKKMNDKSLVFSVDKSTSIRFNEGERPKIFRPDLSVITSQNLMTQKVMTEYYDLKTDLGRQRDIKNFVTKKNEFIRSIRGKKGSMNIDGKKRDITFSENLKYKMVVLFSGNISQKQREINIEEVNKLECVELYTLWEHGDDIIEDEFKRLYEDFNVEQHLVSL